MTNEEEKLVTDNINMANDIAWKYCRKFYGAIPFEELQSSAYLGLIKAAKNFDEEKAFSFSTYAYTVMKNEILKYYNNELKHINNISLSDKSILDIELEDTIASDLDIELDLENKINLNILYHEINKLSHRHKFIMHHRLGGLTMDTIANLLGISQAQVSKDYQRAINILRRKFNT